MSDEAPVLAAEKQAAVEKDTIIIAEDSPPNRKILAHLLAKLGFNVVACEHGGDAWAALNGANNERVICVISDIMMPTMDGLELLRKIRGQENLAALPVILVTAISEKEYIAQAKELKVSGYILKPVTFQRVTSKLQEIFPERVFPKIAA
jgi:two-component system, chemotaxis family, chemotaxis protein CheY